MSIVITIISKYRIGSVKAVLCAAFLIFVTSCAPFLVPNPPVPASGSSSVQAAEDNEKSKPAAAAKERKVRTDINEADFGGVFEESAPEGDSFADAFTDDHEHFTVDMRPIRVMLRRNVKEGAVSSSAEITARTNSGTVTFNNPIHFEASTGNTVAVKSEGNPKRTLNLPCTLIVDDPRHLLRLGGDSYRGTLIITSESAKAISFINVLDVEDYLRGVVPKEIGTLGESAIEAVKVQAVAARTYAYKRMAANQRNIFDLVSTVADQVYAGAKVEYAVSDLAIEQTKDIIMVYGDAIAGAFYHSTCGGKTANIEDVWGGAARPYLRSIDDADSLGNIYCSQSRAFTWEESWNGAQLGKIMTRFSTDANISAPFKGNLRKIEVKERFACGRVKSCSIVSSSGTFSAGGDRVRFLLRRELAANPILRSSNFEVQTAAGGRVVIKGRGYGHGIGMCQTGAIARARAGQNFEQILKAYYSGVELRTVTPQ
ncbi:MAG: SpoIID/LytB domain-containing protein [Chitinispirillia bacterium]|nr:SpoIID/LytB domain-containing protein [Chitinispirillia bacterium]